MFRALRQTFLSRFVRTFARAKGVRLADFRPAEDFDAAAQAELGPALYTIFCHSYGAPSAEVVLDEIVFKAGGYLGLYHDLEGRLVGFSTIKAESIRAGTRACTSLAGSAYFVPGQRGGQAAGRLGLAFALLHKLRQPLRPLVWVFEMLSPISYLRGLEVFAQFYPSPTLSTPPLLTKVAAASIEARGLSTRPGHPLVVFYPDPVEHERTLPTRLQLDSPEVRFYLAQNPRYSEGDILVGLAPVTLLNLLASATATTSRWLRAALAWREGAALPTASPTTPALTRQTGE